MAAEPESHAEPLEGRRNDRTGNPRGQSRFHAAPRHCNTGLGDRGSRQHCDTDALRQ